VTTNRWLGSSRTIAQVVTLTVGSNTDGQTFTTTMNGKAYTYTASGDTTSTIATAIQALLAGSTEPEFKEVTWTVSSNVVTGTAATPGMPFTLSVTGTGTYTLATLTANSGPNDASVAANWSTGALPTDTDDVLIDGGPDILYGLAALSPPAALNSLRVKASFTGNIGLPFLNSSGYVEYRTRFFPVKTSVPVTIGEGDGSGATRVFLSVGALLNLTVQKTASRQASSVPVVNVFGCTGGTANVISGDVGFAADDDTTTVSGITVTANSGATITVGFSATVATMNQDGATINSFGTITTLNSISGTTTLYNAPTTITADGGIISGRFIGTLSTATFRGQGSGPSAPKLDFSADPRNRTITNGSFTGGAMLNDPEKTTTWSNPLTFDALSLAASNLGARFNLTRT
jgi:hypothetical protein